MPPQFDDLMQLCGSANINVQPNAHSGVVQTYSTNSPLPCSNSGLLYYFTNDWSCAIGNNTGLTSQGGNAIAIGTSAGSASPGTGSIAGNTAGTGYSYTG